MSPDRPGNQALCLVRDLDLEVRFASAYLPLDLWFSNCKLGMQVPPVYRAAGRILRRYLV